MNFHHFRKWLHILKPKNALLDGTNERYFCVDFFVSDFFPTFLFTKIEHTYEHFSRRTTVSI